MRRAVISTAAGRATAEDLIGDVCLRVEETPARPPITDHSLTNYHNTMGARLAKS